jgi:hypothetical protein
MTPERFIKDLGALVGANRSQDALDFWRRHYSELVSAMSSEQIVWVADLMHMADMANDLEASDTERHQSDPAVQAGRPA